VGRPLIEAGRWLSPTSAASNEIVLERSFSLAEGIAVGDRITIGGPGGTRAFRVVGETVDTLDCFYPQCGSQFGYVTPATLDSMAPVASGQRHYLLSMNLHDRAAVGSFESETFARYGSTLLGVNDWQTTRNNALILNGFFAAFMGAFAIVLLLTAAVVIASTVMARVLTRYREIGILKAVGLTPREVTSLILGENIILGGAAALLGFVIGCLIAPALALQMTQVLGGGGPSFPLTSFFIMLAVVESIVAGATLLPAWRAGRIPTSQAISQGAALAHVRSSRLASFASRSRLHAPAVTGANDAVARPMRAVLTVTTLVITVIAVVVTLGFQQTFNSLTSNAALLGNPQQLVVTPQGATAKHIEIALQNPRVATWWTSTGVRGSIGRTGTFEVRALGGDFAGAGYVIRSGHALQAPGQTVVGYGLIKRFGLHMGDRVNLTVDGVGLPLTVVGWYSDAEDSGQIALVTMTELQRADAGVTAGQYFVRLHDERDERAVRATLAAQLGSGARVDIASSDLSGLSTFRAAFYGITLLLLLIGLINLVAVTFLGVRERLRDIAVLKTVGFTPRQVGESVATSTGLLGLAAVVLGIPLGFAASWALLQVVGAASGIGPGIGKPPGLWGVVLVVPAAVLVTAGVGALASRGAARAPVVEVLRME